MLYLPPQHKQIETDISQNILDIAANLQAVQDNDGDIAGLISSLAGKADNSGTYAGLRAQSTTKSDVGLGSVPNYSISNSYTSSSASYFASTKAVNDLRAHLLGQYSFSKSTSGYWRDLRSRLCIQWKSFGCTGGWDLVYWPTAFSSIYAAFNVLRTPSDSTGSGSGNVLTMRRYNTSYCENGVTGGSGWRGMVFGIGYL